MPEMGDSFHEDPMRLTLLTLALLLLSMGKLLAQDLPADLPAGEIAGTMTNDDGQPIEAALVDA